MAVVKAVVSADQMVEMSGVHWAVYLAEQSVSEWEHLLVAMSAVEKVEYLAMKMVALMAV